ncbi:MAG: energy transducer TonB, partial [Flavobacteriales bacterium]
VAPASKGVYFDDERVGEWKFYGTDNSLAQKYNYSTEELIYFSKTCTPFSDFICEVKTKDGTEEIQLDQPPMYLGGHLKMMDDLYAVGIRYPHSAMKKGIEGSVVISFFIDVNRKTFGYQIEKGIGGGCDEEALNALTQLSKNWIPGALNGEKVVAKYYVTIDFLPE